MSLDDAAAAIDGGELLEASDEDWNAVHNYWDAMTYIIQLADDPHFECSEALVRSLHFMMMRHDLTSMPGLYRPGGAFVWSTGEQEVVYEGPDPNEVPPLAEELVVELNEDAGASPAMVRAAMAHLNLVMVHPFKDGNGRMARALRSEAAFAKLCGACPIPAGSGKTNGQHRLNRGGNRQANAALYRVVIVRMRWHPPTITYVERRTAEGLSKKDIIRCLKRFVARELYHLLPEPTTTQLHQAA